MVSGSLVIEDGHNIQTCLSETGNSENTVVILGAATVVQISERRRESYAERRAPVLTRSFSFLTIEDWSNKY